MSPRGQGEGGKALWPQRDPGQLECEGIGAQGPQPSVKAPLQGCGKNFWHLRGRAVCTQTLCITHWKPGWPGHRRLPEEQETATAASEFC